MHQQKNQIIMKKEMDKERLLALQLQRREARSNFFKHRIINALRQAGATQNQQQLIYEIFVEEQFDFDNKIKLSPYQQSKFEKYMNQIQLLSQQYHQIQLSYRKRMKECTQIFEIIKSQYTNLKKIKIQYQQTIDHQGNFSPVYQISAFDFFKIIHLNKYLTEVKIQGILIQHFQKFVVLLNCFKNKSQIREQKNQQGWMKDFNPPQNIKLTFDAEITFILKEKTAFLSLVYDLMAFKSLFQQLANITIKIVLEKECEISKRATELWQMWRCLKSLKKLNIQIKCNEQYYQNPISSNSVIRSVLIGGISSLTQINKLSFLWVCFKSNGFDINFLAIEQSLQTLFKNNQVTSLKIHYCKYFPVLPQITTLKQLYIHQTTFRKQVYFLREITTTNPLLRSIKLAGIYYKWTLQENLFDQLQVLSIINCEGEIALINFSPSLKSKIKYLKIGQSSLNNTQCLSVIFPKLENLNCLNLNRSHLSFQALKSLSSPHLSELHIYYNTKITDNCLKLIDQKWPNLRHIQIRWCKHLSENIYQKCEFKGLISLQTSLVMLGKRKSVRHYLKNRGIIVTS